MAEVNGKTLVWLNNNYKIILVIVGIIVGYVTLCNNVRVIESKEIPALKKKDEDLGQQIQQAQAYYHMLNEGMVRLETKVDSVKEDICEIKEELKDR